MRTKKVPFYDMNIMFYLISMQFAHGQPLKSGFHLLIHAVTIMLDLMTQRNIGGASCPTMIETVTQSVIIGMCGEYIQ